MRCFQSLALLVLCALPVAADDVIIIGSGGDDLFRERFEAWGNRLEKVLVDSMGREKEQVNLLMPGAERNSDLETIRKVFAELKDKHPADRDLFIYLIGHGTFLRREAKLQIPGDDLAAEELNALIDGVPARNVVVINAASTGAAFINVLTGPKRVIASATKSAYEENAPDYMAWFLTALEQGSADTNRDQRISIWEAAQQASALTSSFYKNEGLLATEHAILDDNGDGLGTRLHLDPELEPEVRANENPDGALARNIFIKGFTFPKAAPQALIDEYLSLMGQVEAFTKDKSKSRNQSYYRSLESMMLKAAKLHQRIRAYDEDS